VLDSGVDPASLPMNGRVAWFKSYLSGGSQSPNDTSGHGTVVADILGGLAAGTLPTDDNKTFPGGVAPGAGLYFEQVCTSAGSGSCSISSTNFNDFVAQGVRIINGSFGAGDALTEFTGPTDPSIAATQAAFQPAVDAGMLLVWAAGSSGASQPWDQAGLPYWIPSFQPNWLVAVDMAIDSNGNPAGLYKGSDAPSNACGIAMNWCISAPGNVQFPPVGKFSSGYANGTSASAAVVSGVAAQVWQAFPWMSAANVSDTILTTATPYDDGSHTTPNPTYGWGMINALKAVQGPAQFAFGTFNADIPAGVTSTFGNDINGSGGLKLTGPGTLILAGHNTFNGISEIAAGTLTVNGSVVSSVTVDVGGTLNGTGSIGYSVGNNGTVESSGSTAGQGLTIGTNLVDAASSTTAVALGNPLQVHGTASVAGTMNVLAPPSGYTVKSTENLITAGAVSGTFANLTFASGLFYTGTLAYTPTQVNVNLTQISVTSAAASAGIVDPASLSAAQRVQSGFDALNAGMASGGTPSAGVLRGAGAIQGSATVAEARSTLQSLSGQLHAASVAMLFDGVDASGNALSRHFDDLLSGRAQTGIWSSSLGWQGDLQRSGYSGASFRSDGSMVGADVRVGTHALLGFAAGRSTGFGQLDASWDHNRTWMNSVALYGGITNGLWYASAQLANGWYGEDMQRLLQLGALGSLVGTGSTGRYVSGALEGGRLFHLGWMRIAPFVDVRYQRLGLSGFSEQGGLGYGLTADARSAGRLQTGLGVRAERDWRLANGMRVALDGSTDWQHTLHAYGSVFDASFTGFNDWLPIDGIGLSRNTAILRAGLSLWPTRGFGLRLGYTREQGEQQRADSVMLQGALKF
jgi:uncharacterized protein with beta-barrel porin domain